MSEKSKGIPSVSISSQPSPSAADSSKSCMNEQSLSPQVESNMQIEFLKQSNHERMPINQGIGNIQMKGSAKQTDQSATIVQGKQNEKDTKLKKRKTCSNSNPKLAPNPERISLLGRVLQCIVVVEGEFDYGYQVVIDVAETNQTFRGLVFNQNLAVPVTSKNDIAPAVKMITSNKSVPESMSDRSACLTLKKEPLVTPCSDTGTHMQTASGQNRQLANPHQHCVPSPYMHGFGALPFVQAMKNPWGIFSTQKNQMQVPFAVPKSGLNHPASSAGTLNQTELSCQKLGPSYLHSGIQLNLSNHPPHPLVHVNPLSVPQFGNRFMGQQFSMPNSSARPPASSRNSILPGSAAATALRYGRPLAMQPNTSMQLSPKYQMTVMSQKGPLERAFTQGNVHRQIFHNNVPKPEGESPRISTLMNMQTLNVSRTHAAQGGIQIKEDRGPSDSPSTLRYTASTEVKEESVFMQQGFVNAEASSMMSLFPFQREVGGKESSISERVPFSDGRQPPPYQLNSSYRAQEMLHLNANAAGSGYFQGTNQMLRAIPAGSTHFHQMQAHNPQIPNTSTTISDYVCEQENMPNSSAAESSYADEHDESNEEEFSGDTL